ncbi:MAG: CCDC90 family protein [Betaproteobacteria bacterium]|nr:CCDC90 family protein [Betaproteobacteria bacterium]
MNTITFDTLKAANKLKAAGFTPEQAEAVAATMRDSTESADLVTRKDLQIELAPIKADILLLKWMVGVIVAGVVALVAKAFF